MMKKKVIVPNNVLLPEVGRMIAEGVSITLRTKGDSMLPFIVGERDSVVLQQPDKLQVGDIVLARHPRRQNYVLHRIRSIQNEEITLMGDGNLQGVEECTYADVLAKAVQIIRNGRYVEVDGVWERRKAAVWGRLLPIRSVLLAIYRRLCLWNDNKNKKIMSKFYIYLILLTALLSGCGQKSSIKMPADKGNDSIYTSTSIYEISKSNPERALALADTAEMLNLLRTNHTSLNAMKSIIYYNGFRQPRLAYHYALQAYEDNTLRRDTMAYMVNLVNIVSFCQDLNDFKGSIKYATEAIDFIRKTGKFKGEEGKLVMHIAMSQHMLGMDREAKTNMKRSIAICKRIVDRDPCWSNVQNLFFTMGETMSEMGEMGDWQEAAAMIPDLLKVNSLHETLESEAPEGIIDMYRLYTFQQCMEIYQHLGNRKLADEYYQKCLTTDFVKTPEGLRFLVRYQLWIEDYPLALKNIQTVKQSMQQLKKTDNDTYVNKVLVDEAAALTAMGRYKEAADVRSQAIALKDTLFNRQKQDNAQQLAVIYETGEKDAQILKEQNEKRLLLVVVIAIVIALGGVVWHNRKIHRRNVSLVRSVQEGIDCRDELLQKEAQLLANKAKTEALEKKLELLTNPLTAESTPDDAAKEQSGNVQLPEELKQEEQLRWVLHEIAVRQLYLQPGLTAKTVQEELHVAASLFGEFFKEQTGRNFSEHINSLRMDYAAKMLIQHSNYTIDAIGKMCGIDSRQHFHRLFSEYFGITPSIFRKNHVTADN